jgi:polysaccharide export outer membrane protein
MLRSIGVLTLVLLALPWTSTAQDEGDIGPSDVLKITVLGQAEMSGEFTVDANGILAFPFVGDIKASGLTAKEFEKKLTTLLADGYLKRPHVAVSVKEFRSQRVYVVGEVQRPGPYPLRADRTLLSLLGDIGSVGANAGHEVIVTRQPEPVVGPFLFEASEPFAPSDELPLPIPKSEVFRLNLRELQSGKTEANLVLKGGDTIVFPKAANVYVSGHVARPGPYRYEEGTTVMQALNLAGGVTERGAEGRTKIVRLVDGKKVEKKAQPSDILQPEDTLFVPERFF